MGTNLPPASQADLTELLARASEMLFDPIRLRIIEHRSIPFLAWKLDDGRRAQFGQLVDYRAHLATKGKAKHVRQTIQYVRVMIRLCKVKNWGELQSQPGRVVAARQKLRTCGLTRWRRSIGVATVNAYANALKGFCNWMVGDYRADWSPCRSLKPLPVKDDVRHARRALTRDELLRLIDAAHRGRAIAQIPGYERAMCYVLAATTGLRVNELRSLTRDNLKFGEHPHISLSGAHTKNGKKILAFPLRSDVAAMIESYLARTSAHANLFRYPANTTYALRKDLSAAHIAYNVDGEFADNHALRHTFITNLFATGATPKEAQTLARHQDPRLTLGKYAHVTADEQRAAVERLRSFDNGSVQAAPTTQSPATESRG